MKKYLVVFVFGAMTLAGCAQWAPNKIVKPTETPAVAPVEPTGEPSVATPPTTPNSPAPIVQTANPNANIRVTTPLPSESVGSPFTIKGEARVFENQFNWKLKGADGSTLSEGTGYANASDVGQFGPFEIEVKYGLAAESAGTIEVFDYSAKDGAVQDLVSVPVRLSATPIAEEKPITPGADEIAIKVFFANDKLDPEVTCEKVFAAERIVPKAKTMAQVVMAELLKGPTDGEKAKGFSTLINPGVKINRLVIVDGVAQIDFDKTIEDKVGGSCRVTMIRRQITETLKQFPAVKDVVISVEGRTEDALQP